VAMDDFISHLLLTILIRIMDRVWMKTISLIVMNKCL
jgi:hypothetical protein